MIELGSHNPNREMLRLNGSLDEFASVALRHANTSTSLSASDLTPVSLVPSHSPKAHQENHASQTEPASNHLSSRSIGEGDHTFPEPKNLNGSQQDDSYFENGNWSEPVDTVSPSVFGHSSASILDEYTNDPRFVESQRELRSLLFETAHSLAPSRATSPVPVTSSNVGVNGSRTLDQTSFVTQIIDTARRVAYLKNYINEVAPWVSNMYLLFKQFSD